MRTKLLETQSLTNYEGICHWLVWPEAEDLLGRNWMGKVTFLMTGPDRSTGRAENKLVSTGIQLPWVLSADLLLRTSLCSRTFQAQSRVPGKDKSLSLSFAWRSASANSSTRHAARSHVEGLRIGVNLPKERQKNSVTWQISRSFITDQQGNA